MRRFNKAAPAATRASPKPVKDTATAPVLGKTECADWDLTWLVLACPCLASLGAEAATFPGLAAGSWALAGFALGFASLAGA
ncbi:hypothetical protein HMPREF2626_02475 [Aerococcus sp. HMSC062A02]|nr:hypothetical protein HMPREF2626_02475 [Aerococcus sp. HMSC062A02]OHO45702.1 hypothetical protein HMPREF2705_04325 [Aerococcus sp. HMSC035B07]